MTLAASPATGAPGLASLASRAPRRRLSPERIAAALTLVALVVASLVALDGIGISIPTMLESWANAQHFAVRVGTIAFPPLPDLLQATALTVGLVLTGTLLAAVLSVPVAYLAAANTTPGPGWRALGRFVTVLTRSIPDVVFAMVFVLMFSLGALPGILAIAIHSTGMISKLFADAIEQIDEGPRRAIRAAGGSKSQEFTSGILPQVLPSWIATVLHRNDINLRGSVVLGYVGVAGLGREMAFAFKSLDYSTGIGIALVMFALCVVMEIVSSAVRKAMLSGNVDRVAPARGSRVSRSGAASRYASTFGARYSTSGGSTSGARYATGRNGLPGDMLQRPWDRARIRNTAWGWIALAVVVAGVWVCDIQWGDLLTVWGKVPATIAKFWPPSFGAYDWETMVQAMLQTIEIAFAAAVLTFAFSLVIGSFAARNVAPNRGVRGGARLLLVAIRGVPEVILAILLIVVTGLGAPAGTLALAFGGIGLLGKLIADSFEEVKGGPEGALTATGATRLQVYAGATFPQGVPALIGHTFYLLDTNIRAATVLGIVGGGGIGYYLLNAGEGSRYQTVTAIVLMILVTVLAVEGVAMWMRRVFR